MKHIKISLLLSCTPFFFLIGCSDKWIDYEVVKTNIFRYVNESGVEVALVGKVNEYADMPDSLVLQNGESRECRVSDNGTLTDWVPLFPYNTGGPEANPPTKYIPLKIYYNKTIRILFTHRDEGVKNPIIYWDSNSYVSQRTEKKKRKSHKTTTTYTYTFTAEDYQNALKAQK